MKTIGSDSLKGNFQNLTEINVTLRTPTFLEAHHRTTAVETVLFEGELSMSIGLFPCIPHMSATHSMNNKNGSNINRYSI